jgi:hypothetical protein
VLLSVLSMLAEPNIESGADIEVSPPSSCLFSFGQRSDDEPS